MPVRPFIRITNPYKAHTYVSIDHFISPSMYISCLQFPCIPLPFSSSFLFSSFTASITLRFLSQFVLHSFIDSGLQPSNQSKQSQRVKREVPLRRRVPVGLVPSRQTTDSQSALRTPDTRLGDVPIDHRTYPSISLHTFTSRTPTYNGGGTTATPIAIARSWRVRAHGRACPCATIAVRRAAAG